MAMRKKTGKNILKPPASAREPLTDIIETIETRLQSPKWQVRLKAVKELDTIRAKERDLHLLVECLTDRSGKIRKRAAWTLGNAAAKGTDISVTIPALEKALSDKNNTVRHVAANALVSAAAKGTDISVAVPVLAKCLSDGDAAVRRNAAWALEKAAEKGTDISVTIPALGKALSDEDNVIRWRASEALGKAAGKDHQTRAKIVFAIMDITNSNWFIREADLNSDKYIDVIEKLAELMQAIDQAEREAA